MRKSSHAAAFDDQANDRLNTKVGSTEWLIQMWLSMLVIDPVTGQFLPAELEDELVGKILGIRCHDLPMLRERKLLFSTTGSGKGVHKKHSRDQIISRVTDIKWLADAVNAVNDKWQFKNRRRNGGDAGNADAPNAV